MIPSRQVSEDGVTRFIITTSRTVEQDIRHRKRIAVGALNWVFAMVKLWNFRLFFSFGLGTASHRVFYINFAVDVPAS